MLNTRQLQVLNDIFHSCIKPILEKNEDNLNEFIQKGDNNMLMLTKGEKQLILYSKGHFNTVYIEYMNALRAFTAYNYNLSENSVTYSNIESFIVKTFLKLKSNGNIQLDEKEMLIELLQGGFDHQIKSYISWIQSSNFENSDSDIDLGEPDFTIIEKEEF